MGFALVEASGLTPSEGWVSEPFQHKQGALDSADLAQSESKAVLTGIGAELAEDQRGCHRSLLDRSGEPEDPSELPFDEFPINLSLGSGG